MIQVLTVEGDRINRLEVFDEADLDSALARFDELNRPAPRLENAASQAYSRFKDYFVARDWDAVAEALSDDYFSDDRRRVVNAGVQQGRDAVVAELRALADVGTKHVTLEVVATRGGRLVLSRARYSGRDERPEAFHVDAIDVVEIDADDRLVARVVFDLDDFDAAIAELDARFLAGEASAHARTWSAIAGTFAAISRHEIAATTPDWVNIDHRRATAFAPGDAIASLRATWDLAPDFAIYIEAVHRLTDLGAVFTSMAHGASQQGFDAEWRGVNVLTVEGDLLNRCEIFDEDDIGAALARFDELTRPAPRLENAASQVAERFYACFAARDWDGMARILADDICMDDRRRVVGSGIRRGREVNLADIRVIAELGTQSITPQFVATRGERLVMGRVHFTVRDQQMSEDFHIDALRIVETGPTNQITAIVMFDVDAIDAAFLELDARYLAGEAAAHAHSWSVVAGTYTALNRHEMPPTTRDFVNIDHRRGTPFEAVSDMTAAIRAFWDLTPDCTTHIEAVHRLSNLGAVVTQATSGTSQEGLDAEWREIGLVTVEGDLINRSEVFDEADIDAALARFDELNRAEPPLENAATRVHGRFQAHFLARDWDAIAETLAADHCSDDRRRVVNSGIRPGQDAEIASMRAMADLGVTSLASVVIAIRGDRLALCCIRGAISGPEAFDTEVLRIVEIDSDERISTRVVFDLEDLDAAFAELDARYVAGEAAAHSHTWSVIADAYAAFNRRELPATTPDWVNIDHRRGAAFAPGDLPAFMRAGWDLYQQFTTYIEAVHRLNRYGAVVTHTVRGSSPDGFDAAWRGVSVLTNEGDLLNRCEIFDEADLEAALARFEELHGQPRLENATNRIIERFQTCFATRDWVGIAEVFAVDYVNDDRRRIVNAGIRRGRDAAVEDCRVSADVGLMTSINADVIASRGERLVLMRFGASGRDHPAVQFEGLLVLTFDADERIAAAVFFDVDDVDVAFAELEALYLAGEAAAHAHTWSVIAGAYTALNRHEMPPTAQDFVNVDHRRMTAFPPGDLIAYVRAAWNQIPDIKFRIEAVHRSSNLGAVVTQAVHGTSQEGFEADWREIHLMTAEGDLVNRSEMFDEADVDAALTRFDELSGLSE